MALRIGQVCLPLADQRWRGLNLLAYQSAVLGMAAEPLLVIEAPTGGGKTWAGAAPLVDALDRGEGAIFVYPTNALADDQQGSLLALVRATGKPAAVVGADGALEGDDSPHAVVWRIHADSLDLLQEEVGGRRRGDVMSRMFERLPARPLWWVTNPDTLFLLCLARYEGSPGLWNRLNSATALVLDEFHLYRGPSLVRALLLIGLAPVLLGVRTVRILSATLPESLRNLLVGALGFRRVTAEPHSRGRVAQHEVDLHLEVAGPNVASAIVSRVVAQLPILRAESAEPGKVPMVVLLNSVLAAMALEDDLVRAGLTHQELGIYRGLSSKRIRTMDGKTLVLGTSALEVGVDFKTSRLLFEARSQPSFVQRFGRVGRHEPGTAVYYGDERVLSALQTLDSGGSPIPRHRFISLVHDLLEADDNLDGFVQSSWGKLVADAAFKALRQWASGVVESERFVGLIDDVESELRARIWAALQPDPSFAPSRAVVSRLSRGTGFRGSTGSTEVFDVRERRRRGDATLARYDVDLATFYRRATWTTEPEGDRGPVVTGYGKPRKLHLDLRMQTAGCDGLHAPSADQLELRLDGQTTGWECLLKSQRHVVGVFPKSLRQHLSWREDVFESADDRIALLDDDAVVAAYHWQRTSRIGR